MLEKSQKNVIIYNMNRLDKELVERNLVETRTKAQELISNKVVQVNGKIQTKASLTVNESDDIKILDNEILKYVSRGGLKLEKALNIFKIDLKNNIKYRIL